MTANAHRPAAILLALAVVLPAWAGTLAMPDTARAEGASLAPLSPVALVSAPVSTAHTPILM